MKLKDTIEIASLDDGDIIAVNEEHDVGEIAIAGSTEDFEELKLEKWAKGTYILLKAVGTLEVK
mgnify:CR=1 FL=1